MKLSLLCDSGLCLVGLPRSLSAPGNVCALALFHLVRAVLVFVTSGVASLSSLGAGEFGVSPAEESSISGFCFRGVVNMLWLYAGIDGSGFVGEVCWLPIVLDFEGEFKALCVPSVVEVSLNL